MLNAVIVFMLCLQAFWLAIPPMAQAQKLEQVIADAKKEGEVTLVASASTFGGKKGFTELENIFAKRYGFKGKLNLAGGPSFPQVAARIITEQKAGTKSSTDLYLGSDGTYVTMNHRKGAAKSELVGDLSLGDQGDGDFSPGIGRWSMRRFTASFTTQTRSQKTKRRRVTKI